jgi:uncharacterized membrane protein YccC
MTLRAASAMFSLNSFLAAMLALYVGFSLGLPRPYWAMLTVYITAQPLTGALRSKAVFRVLGTLLGALAAVVMVPLLVNAPLLLCLGLATWAGGCLYLSLLDRTPRAYVFMLAGYTAAIIGFPSVTAPDAIFETAVSRAEEITLGIACAAVVHTIVFPHDVSRVLNTQVTRFLRDAEAWIVEALLGRRGPGEETDRRRLAADVTELQVLSTHLPFDTGPLQPRVRAVRALQDRLAILLPLLDGVEDRLGVLQSLGGPPEALRELVLDAAAWAETADAPRLEAEALRERCAQGPWSAKDWAGLLALSAAARLAELIEALQACRELGAYIAEPDNGPQERLDALLRTRSRRPLHRDHGLAALSAVALAAAVLACCGFWISTGWPDGAVAAMMATVFSSFFAAQDDPAPAIRSFVTWTLASLPAAAIYLFAILPAIDGFPLLVVALSPAFLALGYLQASPKAAPIAMPLLIGLAGGLSLQQSFAADFPAFLNGNLALVFGILAALVSTRLLRSLSAPFSARRLFRKSLREISELAAARRAPDRTLWTSLMLDRIGLLAPRLAEVEGDQELNDGDALRDLRVGLNVIDLKSAGGPSSPPQGAAGGGVLVQIADLYGRRAQGAEADWRPAVAAIDEAIEHFLAAAASPAQRRGLISLTGLRRAIGPDAPAFEGRLAA